MTLHLQRRTRTRKEGIIKKKPMQRSTIGLLNTRGKEKLIMNLTLLRILNIRDVTLPLKAENHLMKKKNNREGVVTRLISTSRWHLNREAEWMMTDQNKEDNGMILSKGCAHESNYIYNLTFLSQERLLNHQSVIVFVQIQTFPLKGVGKQVHIITEYIFCWLDKRSRHMSWVSHCYATVYRSLEKKNQFYLLGQSPDNWKSFTCVERVPKF